MKRDYIKKVFTNLNDLKTRGIWFGGVKGEGEYKEWDNNGKLWIHCFWKNDKLDGEYKMWYSDGKLMKHRLFKDGKIIKDYLK